MNSCKNCKKKLKKEWKYCPYCGESTGFRLKIPNFLGSKNLESDNFEQNIERMFSAFGFPVKVNVRKHKIKKRKPKKKIKIKNNSIKERKEVQRKIDEQIEPDAEIKRMPNKTIIEVELPNVKSKKDIKMNTFEESLEIRAYAGNKMYFKVLPLPKNSELIKKTFKNKKLKIIFSK